MLRRLLRPSVAFLLAALVALGTAVPSGAATFGTDLTPPVTSTLTCGQAFNAPSCMAYSVVPGAFAPFSGVVTTVRVKTGDTPQGPMQILVLRQYYQNNLQNPGTPNIFCCFVQEYGPTFTPQPGTVTEVPTTLGMVEQPVPPSNDGNTVATGDFLGLSVLAPDVAIPLTGSTSPVGAAFYAPAPTSPGTPAPSPSGIPGALGGRQATVMMNADITRSGAGAGPRPSRRRSRVRPAPRPVGHPPRPSPSCSSSTAAA